MPEKWSLRGRSAHRVHWAGKVHRGEERNKHKREATKNADLTRRVSFTSVFLRDAGMARGEDIFLFFIFLCKVLNDIHPNTLKTVTTLPPF